MQGRSKTDEWLMAQTARGDRESLEILVRRYASPLLTFIRRMIGDEHRSEELFQDVFLAVWQKSRQYDVTRPFRPWLYQIALNQCRADFRKTRIPLAGRASDGSSTLVDEASLPEPREFAPLESAIATETSVQVAAAVQLLPDQQRQVVVLRIWHSLSYAEIAEIAGCTEVTARSHMHLALETLRKRLTV
jgi:RNA polymerase sigma-70 factor, ECF subfamily